MGKYYEPRPKLAPEFRKPDLNDEPHCDMVRFVLKSGHALELKKDSLDEVVGTITDKFCKAICGCREDGTKAVFESDRVDWVEEC